MREVLLGCRRALGATGGGRARDVRQEELKTMMGVNERVQEQGGEVRTNTVRSAADCALVLAVLRSMMQKSWSSERVQVRVEAHDKPVRLERM